MEVMNVLMLVCFAVLVVGKPTFDDVTLTVDGIGDYKTECE